MPAFLIFLNSVRQQSRIVTFSSKKDSLKPYGLQADITAWTCLACCLAWRGGFFFHKDSLAISETFHTLCCRAKVLPYLHHIHLPHLRLQNNSQHLWINKNNVHNTESWKKDDIALSVLRIQNRHEMGQVREPGYKFSIANCMYQKRVRIIFQLSAWTLYTNREFKITMVLI